MPGGASMPQPKQLTYEIRGDCGVPERGSGAGDGELGDTEMTPHATFPASNLRGIARDTREGGWTTAGSARHRLGELHGEPRRRRGGPRGRAPPATPKRGKMRLRPLQAHRQAQVQLDHHRRAVLRSTRSMTAASTASLDLHASEQRGHECTCEMKPQACAARRVQCVRR